MPLTKTKAKVISKAIKNGDIEVALHGFSHQTIRRVDGGGTEFSGLDYNEQLKRIAKGKSSLEKIFGVRIHTFVPPWNRYDSNTILVLEKLGLKCISADAYHNADTGKVRQLKFLPLTCGILDVQKAVESARRSPDAQPIIVAMFHPYNFLEVNKERGKLTYEDFSNLLSWVASQEDIQTLSIKEVTLKVDNLSVHRFNRFASYYKSFALLPPYLQPATNSVLDDVYISPSMARKLEIRYWIFTSIFYLLIVSLSATMAFIGGRTIFPRVRSMKPISKFGLPSLTILVSVYALHDLAVNYKGITALAILFGACIGVWISSLMLKEPYVP